MLSLGLPLSVPRCCSRPPCRREPHWPGKQRQGPAAGPGWRRACAKTCAGGTPRSRGLHPRMIRTPQKAGVLAFPGSAGVPPASCFTLWPPLSRGPVRCCRQPPCRQKNEQQRPGRRRAMAPFGAVDPSGGDGRGCAMALVRAGRPRSPLGSPSSHDIVPPRARTRAEALGQLVLKEVHLSSCLFVFIRVH